MNPPNDDKLKNFLDYVCYEYGSDWILMVPSSIGEVAAICSFAREFKKIHGQRLRLVVHRNHASVARLFSADIDSITEASTVLMRRLIDDGVIDRFGFKPGMPICMWANQAADGRVIELHRLYNAQPGRGGLSFMDMCRLIMRLPWDAPYSLGVIGSDLKVEAQLFCERNGIERGNSVIFFPGNNTNLPAPAHLWLTLENSFREAGVNVFQCLTGANIFPPQLRLSATMLEMNPALAVAVCKYAGRVIVGSNGLAFLSLLVSGDCRYDVLLTEFAIADSGNTIRRLSLLENSARFGVPEIVRDVNNFREWKVKQDLDSNGIENLAQAIVSGKLHSDQVTYEDVERFVFDDYRARFAPK